jgi:RNA polymerase sigma-70 factor (ECF subfamily)
VDTLTSTFLAHLASANPASPSSPPEEPPAALPLLLQKLDVAARDAWPHLPVPATRFVAYLAGRVPPDHGDLAVALTEIHADDLYLACACVDALPGAVEAFRTRHRPVIAEVIRGIDPAPSFADEVEQILFQRLFVAETTNGDGVRDRHPRIANYTGRGPLAGWVGVAAQRTAISLRRGEVAQKRARERAINNRMSIDLDPELLYLKQRYRVEFEAAFERAVAGLSDRERTILRLHMVASLTLDAIGVIYRVNASTVSRWLAATRDRLSKDTEQDLRQKLHLSPAEFDSLARLVMSQIDLSISRWLQDPGQDPKGDPPTEPKTGTTTGTTTSKGKQHAR